VVVAVEVGPARVCSRRALRYRGHSAS
jgi:hypothetical protein